MGNVVPIHSSEKKEVTTMCATLERMKNLTAGEILSRCNMENTLPVDVFDICDTLQIKCEAVDFAELSGKGKSDIYGAICRNQDNLGIFFEDKESLEEQRFTVAYEIARCCIEADLLKKNHYESRRESGKRQRRERLLVDEFASELLIPENHLRKICTMLANQVNTSSLAKLFKVPEKVMIKRLRDLDLLV